MNAVSEAYDSVFQHNLGLIRLYKSSSLMVNDLTARLAEEVAKTAAAVAEVEDLKTRLAASDALVTSAAAAAVAAIDEEEVVIDLTSESEANEAAEASEAAEAVAPVGSRPLKGLMPEGMTLDQQMKWTYDAYFHKWTKTYKRAMPKTCVDYASQAKWCLEVAYPAFVKRKESKNKLSRAHYMKKQGLPMLSPTVGGGGTN